MLNELFSQMIFYAGTAATNASAKGIHFHNLLSCQGFGKTAFFDIGGACSLAKLGIVILFFILALVKKWGAEEWGIEYCSWLSFVLGIVVYLIIVSLTGDYRIAFVGGLVAGLAGGYGGGQIFGGGGNE
jgi:hypothetical protein